MEHEESDWTPTGRILAEVPGFLLKGALRGHARDGAQAG